MGKKFNQEIAHRPAKRFFRSIESEAVRQEFHEQLKEMKERGRERTRLAAIEQAQLDKANKMASLNAEAEALKDKANETQKFYSELDALSPTVRESVRAFLATGDLGSAKFLVDANTESEPEQPKWIPQKQKQFVCGFSGCGKTFSTQQGLAGHKNKHRSK